MTEPNFNEIEAEWEFLTPMETTLWAMTLALHAADSDGGLRAADEALAKLRSLAGVRSRRANPEDEAAESNIYLTYEEFLPWYTVEHRIRYGRDAAYMKPTPEQVVDAYKHYSFSRESFY